MPKPPPTSGVIDPDALRLDLEDALGEAVAEIVAALAAEGDRPAPRALVVLGDAGARLQVVRDQAVVDEGQGHDPVGAGEGGLGLGAVADLRVEGDVARDLVPDQRRARRLGGLDARDRLQRLPFDGEGFGRVPGRVHGLGDDEGDGVADMAHEAAREHGIGRGRHRVPPVFLTVPRQGKVPRWATSSAVRTRRTPGMALTRREVADREAGMGVGAAHHEAVGRAGRQVVVRVAAGAGDEARVLDAAHGLADAEPNLNSRAPHWLG